MPTLFQWIMHVDNLAPVFSHFLL